MNMEEIWKDIKDYEQLYQISNFGRVRSLKYHCSNNTKILKEDCSDKRGYRRVTLCKNGITKRYLVHRLVYETFVGEIPEGMQVNHRDEKPNNNKLTNIEVVSITDNLNYGNHNKNVSNSLINNKGISKHTLQFSLDGNLIKEWPSVSEICRCNKDYTISNICKCCKGKYKQAYGYIWKYV